MFQLLAVVTLMSLLAHCAGQTDSSSETGGVLSGGSSTAGIGDSQNSGGMSSGGATATGAVVSSGGAGAIATGGTALTGGSAGTNSDTGGVTATGGSDGSIAASFETLKFVIMQAPCFGSGCHNDAQNPLNLMVDDNLYATLTSHISKNCGDLPVVDPGNPQGSALVKILRGPCGSTPRMPLGCVDDQSGSCVPAEYIAAIEQWIADGAPQQ